MKKKLFTIAIALCMVFTMIPGGVFQIETAWAASGDTPASVKVGGVEMVGDNVTYYKNGGTKGSADDYNAMYEPSKNTLTLNNFNYTGTQNGIYADCDLNIVLQGHNSIEAKGINDSDWKNSYGVWTEGDLRIRGENQDEDKLYIRAHNGNAIFAFEDHSSQYNDSITIKNANIIAESFADVGIVASNNVRIENSHIKSYGKTYAIQGGYFDNGVGAHGSITIAKSDVIAKTQGTNAKSAYNIVPTISGVYEWATTETNRTYTKSTFKEFDNAGNPKFVDIVCWHSHCVCGKTHNKVGTHENEEELAFRNWEYSHELPKTAEYYCLTTDVYIAEPWEPADGTVLCLNGHSITCTAGTDDNAISTISVGSGVDFTLTDCSKDENGNNKGEITHYNDLIGRGVDNYGVFSLYGGNISNNNNRSNSFSGGGVQNHIGATFTMYGGSITGNKDVNGAGVYNSVTESTDKRTVFTMYGGTISGNQASYMGGGVYNQGDFIMNGGSIDGNTATSTGGGVFIEVNTEGPLIGTFNVYGNVNITGNKVNGEDDNVYLGMSTDRAKTASIEIGGTLTGSQKIGVKTAKTPTGGDDTVTIATGAKSGDENYFVSEDSNYVVAYDNGKLVLKTNLTPPATEHKHYLCGKTHTEVGDHTSDEETKFTPWTSTDSLPSTAGNYYLTDNVILDKYVSDDKSYTCYGWVAPDNVVLCLNGHDIIMKNPAENSVDKTQEEYKYYDGYVDVIKVGDHFTLTDCKNDDMQGKITHGADLNGNTYNGRGVDVKDGHFDMYGGKITGNTSEYDIGGSGIVVRDDKTNISIFNMYGGTISKNIGKTAGGVSVFGGILNMYGGSIKENVANSTMGISGTGRGAGVYVGSTGEFNMNGGTISKNTTDKVGGGVFASAFAKYYMYGTSNAAKLKISGNAVIKNNTADSSTNNVYLDSSTTESDTVNATLTITGDLTGEIGVTAAAKPPVVIATGATKNTSYSMYIKSDNKEYTVAHDKANGTLVLKLAGTTETKFTIIFDANGGTVDTASAITADDGTLASLPIPTREGYTFKGWYTEATGGTEIEDRHKFTDNGTIYAHWTKNGSSGGGHSYTQRPTIIADEGADTLLTFNGTKLTITAKDGYELSDVLLNGVSQGTVIELTGLRTGDKVEVKTAKKAEPTDPAADKNAKLIKGVENTTIVLKSKLTKNGNVLLTWTKSKGYKVDKFEVYRSVKKNSGYGTKAFFTTADGSWSKYLNTKNLKAGKTYYYKVRGVRIIDGKKYYTKWSNKTWRTVK